MREARALRYALAALDMDGTLLNTAHAVTPWTAAALTRAAEAGGVIALCTGRCMSELWAHLRELPGVSYVIGESGACLYDVKAGRTLHQITFPDDVALAILKMAREYDLCVQFFIKGQSYMQFEGADALRPYHLADFAEELKAGALTEPDPYTLAQKLGHVEKINLYLSSAADKPEIQKRLSGYDLFLADAIGLGWEISLPQASKSAGLARLCEHLGIPISATMAVGDGGNDVDLMRAAGFAVAMGNADAAVRAAADAVTEDNDHDGAAKAILRHMLGEDL